MIFREGTAPAAVFRALGRFGSRRAGYCRKNGKKSLAAACLQGSFGIFADNPGRHSGVSPFGLQGIAPFSANRFPNRRQFRVVRPKSAMRGSHPIGSESARRRMPLRLPLYESGAGQRRPCFSVATWSTGWRVRSRPTARVIAKQTLQTCSDVVYSKVRWGRIVWY